MEPQTYADLPAATKTFMIADLPLHERPRERLRTVGDEALSDSELIAILLRTGTRNQSVIDLSRSLLASVDGDLARLHRADLRTIAAVKGIGMTKALTLRAAFALSRRLQQRDNGRRRRIEHPADVADWLREEMRGKPQEEFHVLALDPRHHVLRCERVTIGLADRSQVHAREVFRVGIREGASRLILAHNHPSGDPTPSKADRDLTVGLVAAGQLIGIEIIDHIVIGARSPERARDWFSFKEGNLLT